MASAEVSHPGADSSPLFWSVSRLKAAYLKGRLSPVDVAHEVLGRIDAYDPQLRAFVTVTSKLLLESAAEAEAAYRRGEVSPLLGIPVSVKDVFHVAGVETSYGSLVHRGEVAVQDSGTVARLRHAGAAFVGKTNTAEFGQSATTENRLLPDTANPWDTGRTPGGSSGGAAASVAAGLSVVALGSDGGGSVRIPAAFTGLVGMKPTTGLCRDEYGFRAMVDFVSPGPMARRAADVRIALEVLSDRSLPRDESKRPRRVGWCPRPEGRPVEGQIQGTLEHVAGLVAEMGVEVVETDPPLQGWQEIFGPLVLADELRERGHLLATAPDLLSDYERRSLEVARGMDPKSVARARAALPEYRKRVAAVFDEFDALLLPTVAVSAFPLRARPREVAGETVDGLWGAFPFAVPFNVAGNPAVTVPVGLAEGLPVGAQLVGPNGSEASLLELCESIEEAVAFPFESVEALWPSLAGS